MKIYLPNSSSQTVGGGFSWIANAKKCLPITDNYDEADIYLIPSSTMVQREDVLKAQDDGKKIVLRVDNAVRNSRNRNTGMSRMADFAKRSDLIIYQSTWAKKYLKPFLVKGAWPDFRHKVILNSVDTTLYHGEGRNEYEPTYLYSRFNRDETKGFEIARYWYSQAHQLYADCRLLLVGQFSPELINGNFDFFMDEQFQYLGVQPPEVMAQIYRKAKFLIYTYFNDACSNTLIEALVSGCQIVGPHYYKATGGAPEILSRFNRLGRDYFGLERMGREYIQVLEGL